MEVSSGPGHSCDLGLAGVREGDSGYYMCMLTQADTYHTRSVVTPRDGVDREVPQID